MEVDLVLSLQSLALSGQVEDNGVTAINGVELRKYASKMFRECVAENASRPVPVDPVQYACERVEAVVLESLPWKYCKFVNSMTLNELILHKDKLVRFRGMVQEVFDPAMYRGSGNVVQEDGTIKQECFVFQDEYNEGTVMDDEEYHDCKSFRDLEQFHCISVPGENTWMQQVAYDLHEPKIFQEGSKYDEINSEEQRNATFAFPLPNMYEDDMLKACIVKVYSVPSRVKMNQVFDFYGVLSLYTEGEEIASHNDDFEKANDEDAERMVREPRPQFVPRIHCVTFIPISPERVLEAIPRDSYILGQANLECMAMLEKLLLDTFMGDEVVTKYVMCNLISNIEVRVHGGTPVGCFPVMISNIHTDRIGKVFSHIVETLTPKSYFIDNLQTAAGTYAFAPVKDFRTNKLRSGLLQLSEGTHLVVQDLTRTNDIENPYKGLTSSAKSNLQMLEKLMEWQTLRYDYKYSQMEINHDIPVIVLSQSRAMLQTHNLSLIPWCQQMHNNAIHDEVIVPDLLKFLKNPDIANSLRYCLQETKLKECPLIGPLVHDLIAGDFVKSRQNNDSSRHMTESDLTRCLTMTKCLSKLRCSEEVSYDTWKVVLSMESERKRRLAEMPIVN